MKNSNLSTKAKYKEALALCLRDLEPFKEFKNNEKFINLWITFASLVSDPRKIFKYMRHHKIGLKVAKYYCATALTAEKRGDIHFAQLVYQKGIENKAEPLDYLKTNQNLFLARIGDMFLKQGQKIGVDTDAEALQAEKENLPSFLNRNEAKRVLQPITRKQAKAGTRLEKTQKRRPTERKPEPFTRRNWPLVEKPLIQERLQSLGLKRNTQVEIYEDKTETSVSAFEDKDDKVKDHKPLVRNLCDDYASHQIVDDNTYAHQPTSWNAAGLETSQEPGLRPRQPARTETLDIYESEGEGTEPVMRAQESTEEKRPVLREVDLGEKDAKSKLHSFEVIDVKKVKKVKKQKKRLNPGKSGLHVCKTPTAVTQKVERTTAESSEEDQDTTLHTQHVLEQLEGCLKSTVKGDKVHSRFQSGKKDRTEADHADEPITAELDSESPLTTRIDLEKTFDMYLGHRHYKDGNDNTIIEFNPIGCDEPVASDMYKTPVAAAPKDLYRRKLQLESLGEIYVDSSVEKE